MADILKYVIDYFQSMFSSLGDKVAKEALPIAIKLVMDKFSGDARLDADTRLQVQGLILDALRTVGFKGASDERDSQ